jgi:hypothetical protein
VHTKNLELLEKAQLPPAQARAILEVMEMEFATDVLATKADLGWLKADLGVMKVDLDVLKADLGVLKADLQAEMRTNFATKSDLANTKADLMKWIFLFWVGQMAASLAIARFMK